MTVQTRVDIPYAPVSDWEKHTLDLYIPSHSDSSESPTAVNGLIVFVHGGAWRTGDKSGYVDLAKNLAQASNHTVAVVNYSLSIANIQNDPTSVPAKAQHPKHVKDVALALGFLFQYPVANPGLYDPSKIYLVGHSAGGQITGMLALCPWEYLEPVELHLGIQEGSLHGSLKGVIGVEGIYDVAKLLEVWPSYSDFVIQGFGSEPRNLVQGSPQGQVIAADKNLTLPPYAVIQSRQDGLVDDAQASDYAAYLRTLTTDPGRVALEFGDWGSHDDMLQTEQFTRTVVAYIYAWKK